MVIRRLTLLSLLTAILFVQEELLSFLPNVQFSFLLIFTYACCLSVGESLMIVTVHVFLDSLYMGAMNPFYMLAMFVGYTVLVLLGHFARNSALWVKCLLSALGTLCYALAFLPVGVVLYHVSPWAYLLADLPFDGILVACTVITMLLLHVPLKKCIDRFAGEKTSPKKV